MTAGVEGRNRIAREARGAALAAERLLVAGLLLLAGCAHKPPSLHGKPGISDAPHLAWIPPREARLPVAPAASPALPPDLADAADHLSLAQLVDLALRTSTETRAAWEAARAAAAAYGSSRGDYLPEVNLTGGVTEQKSLPSGDRAAVEQRTQGGALDASWLLFDFGGREAAVEETRQALVAADWNHNAVIQNVILRVEQAYYRYVTARALLGAAEATQAEARRSLDAAEARHRTGLATIADVLQARTSLSQVDLTVEGLRGEIAATRGALATSMGFPANTPFDVEPLPQTLPQAQVSEEVERYLERAVAERPDLAAVHARARAAGARASRVRAGGYPSLHAQGSAGRFSRNGSDRFDDSYSVGVQLRLPIFTGFSHGYDVRQSEAEAAQAQAGLESLRQAVLLEVWTSYYDFKTAERRLAASQDLVRSATQSHDVALGRYREGVGTILDLLTTQAALEGARAQEVEARSDWFLSLTQLAHDTGTLGGPQAGGSPAGEAPAPESGSGDSPQEENR